MPQVVVFDMWGQYGFFRIPGPPEMAVTFPFPPRTAILGLIGAILGLPRNSYWMREHPLRSSTVAVEIIRSKVASGRVDEIPRSPSVTVRLDDKEIVLPSGLIRGGTANEGTRQVSILIEPRFRVYFSCHDSKIMVAVQRTLEERVFYYRPYLGHTSMPAELEYLGLFEYKPMSPGTYEVCTVIPADDAGGVRPNGNINVVTGVPMTLTANRVESDDGELMYSAGPADCIVSIGYQLIEGRTRTTVTSSQEGSVLRVLTRPPVYVCKLPCCS